MHPRPGRILKQYLAQGAEGVIPDARIIDAYLSDLCGAHIAERFVLVQARRLRIPEALQTSEYTPASRRRLVERLRKQCAFEESAALYAVETWADVLGLSPRLTLRERLSQFWPTWTRPRLSLERISGPDGVQYRRIRRTLGKSVSHLPFPMSNVVGLLVLILAIALALVGFESVDALLPNEGPLAAWEEPSLNRAVERAHSRLDLPTQVLIDAELLNVRAEPDIESPVLGIVGPQGAQVLIEELDVSAGWGRITSPVAGWIATEYVLFHAGSAPLRLKPGLGTIAEAGLPVRGAPTPDAVPVGTLAAGGRVEALGTTPDGAWALVAWPLAGWIDSRYVEWEEKE